MGSSLLPLLGALSGIEENLDQQIHHRASSIFLNILSGDHVIAWRKGHVIISAGEMVLSRDHRFRLHSTNAGSGNKLTLKNIRTQVNK